MVYRNVPVSEAFDIISGGTPKRKVEEYWNGDIPWISIKDFNDQTRFLLDTEEYITKDGLKNSSTNILEKNDIIISARGTVGKVNMIRKPMAFNQSCYGLRAKGIIDPTYGYFVVKNSVKMIQSQSYGSVFSTITRNNFNIINIPLYPLKEQQLIVNVLSSLDDKIENNNAIIANLEEQAQTIFKSWFIDFKPFQDGEFIDSELGEIPAGWDIVALDEIANYQNGLAMQKYRPVDGEESLPVLKIRELRANRIDRNSESCTINIPRNVRVFDGDVIFSWSGSLLVEIWTGGDAGLNQHLFKVTSDMYNKWFYYYWTKYFLEHFVAIAKDRATTMGHIKRSHLKEAKVLIPDKSTMNQMDSLMNPFVLEIINLGKQNKKLQELRDTLLPKLMSGEIRVGDIITEE